MRLSLIFCLLLPLLFPVQGLRAQEVAPYGDEDGDGVVNKYDLCRYTPGPPERSGCPEPDPEAGELRPYNAGEYARFLPYADPDFDGVPNEEDRCPESSGPPEREGCPASDPRLLPETLLRELAPKGIDFAQLAFERGDSRLNNEAFRRLSRLNQYLRQHPFLRLEVVYADGGPEGSLNRRRARAIIDYLSRQGIAGERLRAIPRDASSPQFAPSSLLLRLRDYPQK
jgi:outer membrane protein OmpA-like peptidoglycan-associated protein